MFFFLFLRIAMFFLRSFKNVVAKPARFVILNSVMLSSLCAIFAVLSGTGYIAAYRALIPTVQVERDVHFKYAMRPCKLNDHCQHPVAEVWLGDDPSDLTPILSPGTEYRLELNLELPESDANFDVGMFMASVELRTPRGHVLKSAQRSGVLVYRSAFLRMLQTMLSLPSLLLGAGQEKQMVRLPMFESFVDRPQTNEDFAAVAFIELHSTDIQLYSAKLRIYAEFGGLRYIMYRWPLTSAAVGFGVNFVALWIVMALFWIRSRLMGAARMVTRKASSTEQNGSVPSQNKKDVDETKKPSLEKEPNGMTQITHETADELDSRLAKVSATVEKLLCRLPFMTTIRPYAAVLLNFGLRWSPIPIPSPVATFARQIVGAHKCKLA